ncbi:hypothetical protein FSP39_004625 [Pinctada imbricata]|uniref:Tripartite motif-containing protein 2 n=1 Tax=Pinctada imbricata TaxID=66713 RepID=A0AA88XV11_PINIB|nr:hypothetical protein FSP39_004625 [Pinctada imbricata]
MGKIDYKQNRGNPMHDSFEQIEERFKIKTSNFRANIYGRSIEPVSKHAAWVSDHSSEVVYLYDSQGKKLRSDVIRGSRGILDIAVCNNGDIIVSREDLKVSLLSVKGVLTTLIDTAPFVPTGICLTNKGKIVVGMSDQGGKNHVAVYTRYGKSKLRKITGRLKHNTHLFTFPYRVTVIENQIIALNHWENIVSVNENSGKLNWQYDGGLARRDKEFGPVGLCSDRFSHVFVTDDNNHCIHIIDGKGITAENHIYNHEKRDIFKTLGNRCGQSECENMVWKREL